ncbi:unnamed protein product [Mycena citricolor]|uniref:Uncharacterized protein n=1 Tax=Mycena citricolor TaxID=2018698 RepID=A0AAD2H8R8_9AGAR|nr:unnamed protein product [Mycena citricolor]
MSRFSAAPSVAEEDSGFKLEAVSSLDGRHSRMDIVDSGVDPVSVSPVSVIPPASATTGGSGLPFFDPLSDDDVFDVFDLELVLGPGGKDTEIDARYRSSDSSSGRPTYRIQKKMKAHFLGKKNMSVEVLRSQGWDAMSAMPTPNATSKGYITAFVAKDQPSRCVTLTAANSILSKSTIGNSLAVSSACGLHDPSRLLKRDTPAHHFFLLKLNHMGMPDKFPSKGGPKRKGPAPPSPAAPSVAYEGGGYFVLECAPPDRGEVLSTLYCTGYDQRPRARKGDIAVAELRVRPVVPGTGSALPPWARFFKERHVALHISRRGLGACMTGPQVNMVLPGVAAGRCAVLSRGQAMEVVLSTVCTALLAIEQEGFESKRWAWLSPRPIAAGSLNTLKPAPSPLVLPSHPEDNPGLASPDGSGSTTAAPSEEFDRTPGQGMTFPMPIPSHTPYSSETRSFVDATSIAPSSASGGPGGNAHGIELDDWMSAPADEPPAAPPVMQSRKNSLIGAAPPDVHHLKGASWSQKIQKRQSTLSALRKESTVTVTSPLPAEPQRGIPWPEDKESEEYMFA